MRTKLTIAAATAALATGGVAAACRRDRDEHHQRQGAATATAATRHVEGRVTAIDRSARTFTVRDAERGTLKVKVTSSTKFERVTLRVAAHRPDVDVRAKRVAGAWNATKVERGDAVGDNHDAGDDHGGDDRHGGNDDGPTT